MKVIGAKFVNQDNRPVLHIKFDDERTAKIVGVRQVFLENKFVPLGSDFDDQKVYVDSDFHLVEPDSNLLDREIACATDDPKVLALVVKFTKAVNNIDGENFLPGDIDITKV